MFLFTQAQYPLKITYKFLYWLYSQSWTIYSGSSPVYFNCSKGNFNFNFSNKAVKSKASLMETQKQITLTLLFLTFSLYFLTILPRLLSYGMFFDGVTYASIARNLAEGFGSFWQPYYTETVYPEFYEHPPLGLFLQSLAFKIAGDSLRVEAFYGFFASLVVLSTIWLIWRLEKNINENQAGGWVPVLMCVFIPMTSYLFSNNFLEGTLTVFTTLAALFAICSLLSTKRIIFVTLSIFSGIMIFCAVLVKGPVGLFPLAIPFIWYLTRDHKNISRPIITTLLMLLGILGISYILILSNDDFLISMKRYYSRQVVASLSGNRDKSSDHFGIIMVTFREVIVPFLVGIVVWTIFRIKKHRLSIKPGNVTLFYFLIALSGSLPIAISPKQLMWYVYPSFPFFALAIASMFNAPFKHIEDVLANTLKSRLTIVSVGSLIFIGSIVWMFAENGMVRKEKEFHKDFSLQVVHIPSRQIISVYPPNLKSNWPLVANMQRSFRASLTDSLGCKYLLTTIDQKNHVDSLGTYKAIHPPDLSRYLLYIHN